MYLACWLRGRGHRNVVVCRKGSPLEREARRLGLETMNLPFLFEWDPLSAAMLRRAAGRSALPAVLHAHTSHAAALASLASRGGWPPWVAHRRVDFLCSGPLSRRLKYDSAGAVLAVSDYVRGQLLRQGVPEDRVRTVTDCLPVDAEEARRCGMPGPPGPAPAGERPGLRERLGRPWGLPPDAPWIGNVAALVPHKDQATLLRAVGAVRRGHGKASFLLIGDGPLRKELESLARELGVADAVRFVGHQGEVVPWLQALDLYVQSSWGEGMGSVLLEAMACRVPIVATAAGGIPEVIDDGVSGLLVPPRDPERLGAAVARLLADADGARAMAERGARRLADFSLSRYGSAVESVYLRVAAR